EGAHQARRGHALPYRPRADEPGDRGRAVPRRGDGEEPPLEALRQARCDRPPRRGRPGSGCRAPGVAKVLTSATSLPIKAPAMGLSEVSNILWRERQLLELLLY